MHEFRHDQTTVYMGFEAFKPPEIEQKVTREQSPEKSGQASLFDLIFHMQNGQSFYGRKTKIESIEVAVRTGNKSKGHRYPHLNNSKKFIKIHTAQ